jgi:hypothetical protein
MFLNSIEMKTLDFHSLMRRILERVPSLCGKEVALKYLDDREDWVDLPIGDLDSFIDMVGTARNSTRENLKIIQLKVNELANTPQDGAKHGVSQKRSRVSPSPSPKSADAVLVHMAKKSRSLSAAKCLEFDNTTTETADKKYRSPADKFFDKLSKDKDNVEQNVAKKQRELSELQNSCKPLTGATVEGKKASLCSVCHSAGHNKSICSFPPCSSATICKEIKRHPDEEKYMKQIQYELKVLNGKLKQLENDLTSKKESYASALNTFAAKVQANLINSNPDEYLRKTIAGDNVPNWLVVNTDIRKLERVCKGKVPDIGEIQNLLTKYEAGFDVFNETVSEQSTQREHVNPVVKLWEQKGIKFPGKGVLPNSTYSTISQVIPSTASGQYFPATLEEENYHIKIGIEKSLQSLPSSDTHTVTGIPAISCTGRSERHDFVEESEEETDYGLSLLFKAAQIMSE